MENTKSVDREQPTMIRVFEAVYENGVLKPLQDPHLPEHQRFSVQVQELAEPLDAVRYLEAGHKVYEGLSEEDIADIEEIALGGTWFSRSDSE